MKPHLLAFGALGAFASITASATDDYNRTINSVGVANSGGYIDFKEGLSQPCLFNVVYLPDPNSGAGRAMLALLLNAQARSVTLSTVSYTLDANSVCTATNFRSN